MLGPYRFADPAAPGLKHLPTLVSAAVEAKRFKQLTVEELTPQQHQVADKVLKVSSLWIQGPYNVMLRSPVMAQRQAALLDRGGPT